MRRTIVLTVAALLAACSNDQSKADAAYMGRTELPPSAVVLRIDAAGRVRTFRGADLETSGLQVRTPTVSTATGGTLRVSYVLGPADAEASRGEVSLGLRDDWGWGVTVQIDSANPTRFCFGCMGAQSFPLAAAYRRSAKDSVWMTWGGNSIKNPVVY
jgi:hypothetical protein